MTYKLRAVFQLDAPKFGSRSEFVTLEPRIISLKWTKNNHLVADDLTVTLSWQEAGVDPRMLKNARCALWLWDSNWEDLDREKHLRFEGICKFVHLQENEVERFVELTFHDYTTLFIDNKPLATTGMPDWTDTLEVVWDRICANTGWVDPDTGEIKSSVDALRGNLVFERPEFASRTLGDMVNPRFRSISKPQPRQGASSWDVWQWCVSSLGLISFIEGDRCIITDTQQHYSGTDAAIALYGANIRSPEMVADTQISSKGVLLKSFDPLRGLALEAFYPPPGDARLKIRRGAARPKSEGGTSVTENEQSADYEEFNRFDITDQAALQRAAQEGYEERSRQELQGSFHTAELRFNTSEGAIVDLLSLRAGDTIAVVMEPEINREVLLSLGGEEARVRYLVDNCDYDEDVARLVAKNLDNETLANCIFHLKSLEIDYGPDHCEIEIKFHNIILTNS